MTDGSKTYVLGTGTLAAKRLDIQSELLAANSYKHLKKAGLSMGKVVFDIGCGSGAMSVYLAKVVGSSGHVYAVDVSEKQLEFAEAKVKQEGLDNVTFIHADISSADDLPKNIADIVYMRLVLMHMQNPEKAIEKIKSILRPDGVVVSQEYYGRVAANNAVNKYVNALSQLRKYHNVDYNIGEKLELMYKNAGYSDVKADHMEERLTAKDAKEIFVMAVAEWKDKAIEAEILSLDEVNILEQALKDMPETNEEAMRSIACCVIAQK